MSKILLVLFTLVFSSNSRCQVLLNGSFEATIANKDALNIKNFQYDMLMPNSLAFGTAGNMDIIKSDTFCGAAQHGNWFVALTGGGTDIISLKLSKPLQTGFSYSVAFYDRMCPPVASTPHAIQIGESEKGDEFGELIYISSAPELGWTRRNFTFTAQHSSEFITIKINAGGVFGTWIQVDNFSLSCELLFDLGADTTICDKDTIELNAHSLNATFLWNDGSFKPTNRVTAPGKYWVEVNNGVCIRSDTIMVSFQKCSGEFFIPGAFTPNGDGQNDLFHLFGDLQNFEMEIYNRWGNLLFRTKNIRAGWDGKAKGVLQPGGAYIYLVRYTGRDNLRKVVRGSLILLK